MLYNIVGCNYLSLPERYQLLSPKSSYKHHKEPFSSGCMFTTMWIIDGLCMPNSQNISFSIRYVTKRRQSNWNGPAIAKIKTQSGGYLMRGQERYMYINGALICHTWVKTLLSVIELNTLNLTTSIWFKFTGNKHDYILRIISNLTRAE